MKNGVFVTLFLSAVLALPAFTQQTSSDSSAQAAADTTVPASQNQATGKPPLQPVTTGDFWDGDDPNAVNLVTHPFARKSYVHRQTDPSVSASRNWTS